MLSPYSRVEEGITRFLEYLARERNYAPRTVDSYRSDLQQFARFLSPRIADVRVPLRSVQREVVAEFLAELRLRGLKPNSVARKLASIRSLFHYVCRMGVLAANPARAVNTARPRRRVPPALGLAEVEDALELAPAGGFAAARDRAILEVLYGGGIRLGELAGLGLSSLDLGEGTVRVLGRGHRERIVPIGRPALRALSEYLRRRAGMLVEMDITQVDAGALFLNAKGRRLSRRSVQRVVGRCLGRALRTGEPTDGAAGTGTAGLSPRLLRHTYAAHLLDAGADLRAVKELLGHANLATTQIYVQIGLEQLQRIYAGAHPRARAALPPEAAQPRGQWQ
ncbi:MAG: tyrosine-type recombinase/integrase [Candidatus Latescibacterota bacterium]